MSILLALIAAPCAALGATTSSWLNPVNGDWTNPANWFPNSNYPNNGFPTAADTYDATISATGLPYTVTANASVSSITIDSATVNSSDATLTLSGGTFRAQNGLVINNGSFNLAGATLLNTTISGSGGPKLNLQSGLLSGVTLRKDALIEANSAGGSPSPLNVLNGLTLDASTVYIRGFNSAIQFGNSSQTIGGNGTFDADGGLIVDRGNLTIGENITILGNTNLEYTSSALTNRGTIRATANVRAMRISSDNVFSNFNNFGIIEAMPGGTVALEGPFNNAGVMRASGGLIEIGGPQGTYSTGNLGTLDVSTGIIYLSGTLNNANSVVTASAAPGKLVLGGVVNGGTLASAPSAQFYAAGAAFLNGVTLTGKIVIDPTVFSRGESVRYSNLTMNGGVISLRGTQLKDGANALFYHPFGTTTNINGTGEIVFDVSQGNQMYGGTVTTAPGITIRTGTGSGSIISMISNGKISARNGQSITIYDSTNQGTIEAIGGNVTGLNLTNSAAMAADAGSITLDGPWSNPTGTIAATNGSLLTLKTAPATLGSISVNDSTLALDAAFTTPQIASLSVSNSTIALTQFGILSNADHTFTLRNGNSFHFRRGRVSGGTLAAASIERYIVDAGGTISGVTLAAPLTINPGAALNAEQSLPLENVDILITSDARQSLLAATNAPISGTGNIIFNGTPGPGRLSGFQMTIGPNISARTGTGSGIVGETSVPFTNQGTLSSPNANLTLQVTGGGWTNDISGKLQAANQGVLSTSGSWTNKGTLHAFDDGVINVSGPMTNLPGASATAESGGDIFLNTNTGAPATATAAAKADLAVHIKGFGSRLVLGANQDLGAIDLDLDGPGNPLLDLASSGTAPRMLRVHPSDFEAAWGALDAAIRTYNATHDRGIFDSNLRPGARIAMARQIDLHNDPMILIRPARIGDVNLDNSVTIADFIDLASHMGLVNATWRDGDLNYDGLVSIADFIELAGNFNTTYSGQSFPISAEDQLLLSKFAAAHAGEVPEPSIGLLLLGMTWLLSFRRRK